MALIHISRNPLGNINATDCHPLAVGSSLQAFVDGSPELHGVMLVAVVNGEPRLRADWGAPLLDSDVVLLLVLPRGGGGSNPLRILASLAVLTFAAWAVGATALGSAAMGLSSTTLNVIRAGIVLAGNMLVNQLMPLPTQPESRSLPEPSPTYSLRGQSNMARVGQPIPLHYGRHIIWPDLVMSPYYEYDGKDQWYHVLLCCGLGYIAVTDIKFGDVALAALESGSYGVQVAHPGEAISLLPATVYTANVSGVELAEAFSTSGFSCPPGTAVSEIGLDFALNGLVKINRNGDMQDHSVTAEVQARRVNDVDAPLTGWSLLLSKAFTAKTVDAVRESVVVALPQAGRYEVQVRVTAAPHTERDGDGNTFRDTCIWGGLRGYNHDHPDYGDVTLLAVRVKANELLSQQSTQQISCVGTRYLSHWTASGGWSGLQASRSIVWAMVDAYLSPNNGNQTENTLLLDELATLHTRLESLNHHFDYRFDESGARLLETLNIIARAGRSVVVHHIGRWRALRDEQKTVPVQMFTADNIRDFSVSLSAPQDHDPDALVGTFIDADTWQQATLTYSDLADPLRPETVDLPGVTSRQHAWEELAYLVKSERRRERGSFVTGMEGRIPVIHDLIAVCPEGVDWGYYGHVLDKSGSTLTLSNPLPFASGKIMLRNARGGSLGVFSAAVNADGTATVAGLPALTLPDVDREPVYYIAGETEQDIVLCKVTELKPQQNDLVQIGFVVEDASVYAAPGAIPADSLPVIGGGGVNLAIPWLTSAGQAVAEGACRITFAWGAAPSAELYEADYQVNDGGWTPAALSGELGYTLDSTPSQLVAFRVRAKSVRGIGTYQQLSVTACGAELAVAPDPGALALESPFTGPVLKVKWALTQGVSVYLLRIYDTATMTLRREVQTSASRYDYSYLDAQADGGTHRNMTLRLHTTRNGVVSDVYSQLTVGNPQVSALSGVSVVAFSSQVMVTYTRPTDADMAGVLLYKGSTSGFSPAAANLVYDGDTAIITAPLNFGETAYLRLAAYDFWGRDNLNLSAQYTATAGKISPTDLVDGLEPVQIIPGWPNAFPDAATWTGSKFVSYSGILYELYNGAWRNVIDAERMGGQIASTQITDGAILTPKLAANAVVADKIAANAVTAAKIQAGAISADKIAANAVGADKIFVNNLAAISAAMGTVTTGKLQNASGRALFNLDASGTDNFIQFSDSLGNSLFNVNADGRCGFRGAIGLRDPESGLQMFAVAQQADYQAYIADAQNPTTANGSVAFVGPNNHPVHPVAQRCRSSTFYGYYGQPLTVLVTASAVVDHHFTLWWSYFYEAIWRPLITTYDPVGGDGSVTLTHVATLNLPVDEALLFCCTSSDPNKAVYDSGKKYLRNLSISAAVVNV